MVFLMKPSFFSNSERRESAKPGFLDYSFAVLIAVPALYSYFEAFRINMRLEDVDDILQVELILGGIMTVLILEAIYFCKYSLFCNLLKRLEAALELEARPSSTNDKYSL